MNKIQWLIASLLVVLSGVASAQGVNPVPRTQSVSSQTAQYTIQPQTIRQANKLPNQDSLALMKGPWIIDTLEGLVVKTAQFQNKELFGTNQYIAIIEIPSTSPFKVALSYEPRRTKTSVQAQKHHAVAAINGSFFDMAYHNPICYLKINGKEISENIPMKPGMKTRKYYQTGTVAIRNGRPMIFRTDSLRNWEHTHLKDSNIMTAGPLLIYHGKDMPMRTDKEFVAFRHNRSAIGIKEDGSILLVAVDGRTNYSSGMSLPELIKTLRWLGCRDALNFDGGGSTTLYLDPVVGAPANAFWRRNNSTKNGLLNHPTDNGKYDFLGERTVSSCLLIVR